MKIEIEFSQIYCSLQILTNFDDIKGVNANDF